jgi:inhibitor of KinA sporulation pathway (predicted exonuclease)
MFLSGQQLYQSGGFFPSKVTGYSPSSECTLQGIGINMLGEATNSATFRSVSQNNTLQEKMFNYFLEKNNYITPFLFAISNNILKRLLNSTLLIFIQQLSEPDLDYINRQKKGVIFWDVWGEYLKQVAEDNSINIYELTTDKEEQIKLLSKYEEVLIGESNNLKNINGTTKNMYFGTLFKGLTNSKTVNKVQTNQNLKLQLVKNQELAAQSLAQEREKQDLLANQNRFLEEQV